MGTKRKRKPKTEQQKTIAKIEEAFARKASDMHGVQQSRNKRWRIAEAERKLTVGEDDCW